MCFDPVLISKTRIMVVDHIRSKKIANMLSKLDANSKSKHWDLLDETIPILVKLYKHSNKILNTTVYSIARTLSLYQTVSIVITSNIIRRYPG